MYSITTLRKKANAIGLGVEKGFVHYLSGGAIYHDHNGNRESGYEIMDYSTGFYVWGSYNSIFDHLFTIEDVEDYLREEYRKLGLRF